MNKAFTQTGFDFELTEDGSPTLHKHGENGEKMHHSGGAAAETRYIYKTVIEKALTVQSQLRVSVVGLGLGYIEISWAQVLLKLGQKPGGLVSYEIDGGLVKSFQEWLSAEGAVDASVYTSISKHLEPEAPVAGIRELLKENFTLFPVRGDIRKDLHTDNSFQIVCFDAFSRKASEELWTEEFLNQFLKVSCHQDCVFTTYACTGALKKALRENDFTVMRRPGFGGKRDSTVALRGTFKTSESLFRIF